MSHRIDLTDAAFESDAQTQETRTSATVTPIVLPDIYFDEPEQEQPDAPVATVARELPEELRDQFTQDLAQAAITGEHSIAAVCFVHNKTRQAGSKRLRDLAAKFPQLRRPKGHTAEIFREAAARGWETRRKKAASAEALATCENDARQGNGSTASSRQPEGAK